MTGNQVYLAGRGSK